MRKFINYFILFFLVTASIISAQHYFKFQNNSKTEQKNKITITNTDQSVIEPTTTITQIQPTTQIKPSPSINSQATQRPKITATQAPTKTIPQTTIQNNIENNQKSLPNIVTIKIINTDTAIHKLEIIPGDTVLDIMKKSQNKNQISFNTKKYSYGEFIYEINGVQNNNSSYWFLYLNGKRTPAGASQQKVYTNDIIEWKFEN